MLVIKGSTAMTDYPDGTPQDEEDLRNRTTYNVDAEKGDYRVPDPAEPPSMLPGSIAFYLPGRTQPVVFKGQPVIVVGRYSPETPDVLLDLTSDHGVLLGVSRRHAVIEWSDTGYVVHDLGSTNGTFVNERKLLPDEACPLNSGDQMRLGQLLSIVYISAQETAEMMLYLLPVIRDEKSAVTLRLTPLFLLQVGQYLQTLQELHTIMMNAMGEHGDSFVIQQIKIDDAGRSVEITLSGISASLQQLCQFLTQLKPADKGPDLAEVATLPERPLKPPSESSRVDAPSAHHRLYGQLARRMLTDMKVLFADETDTSVSRIGALLQRLLESQIRQSTVPPM